MKERGQAKSLFCHTPSMLVGSSTDPSIVFPEVKDVNKCCLNLIMEGKKKAEHGFKDTHPLVPSFIFLVGHALVPSWFFITSSGKFYSVRRDCCCDVEMIFSSFYFVKTN